MKTHPSTAGRSSAGLCTDCRHTERIASSRGSTFYLCRLSLTDPQYVKYPRLPVLACAGYQPTDKTGRSR
jgi:hypothetical protein